MFFYDPSGQLIGDYQDNAATTTPADDWLIRQETVWLGDIPVGVITKRNATGPIQVYYIHTGHLNTPRVIVNRNNVVVWRWEGSHAFGANLPIENLVDATQIFEYNLRFPGQYFDKETGLHYNYFRYYEPEMGRYISTDPIGLMGGMNTYEYANGNSMMFMDSHGLASCTYSISTGRLICMPDNPVNSAIDIPVASGNNGRGMQCKNNPACINIPNRGPIPIGLWTWNINGPGAINTKPNGRRLIPAKGTNTYGRSGFLTHSCMNAFGPSLGPAFCSEGCVTGSANSMQQLNQLLDAEPTSTLNVME